LSKILAEKYHSNSEYIQSALTYIENYPGIYKKGLQGSFHI